MKPKYVSPMNPVASTYNALRQVVAQLPTVWPHVRQMRAILNSDAEDWRRKNDPDGPEKAIIGQLVLYIDEKIPKAERMRPYVRTMQMIIIEFMDVMKEYNATVIDFSQLRYAGAMDMSRHVVHDDDDEEIEIDRTQYPGNQGREGR